MAPVTVFAILATALALEEAWLDADDCASSECSLELRQLRGQRLALSTEERIAQQIEENKKYETSLDDESGHVCVNNPDVATPVNCQQGWKCCTSKRSYISGVAHETQSKLKLYSICCQMDQHCKYDTIFVSCAPGAGPDDYSGVLAGLEEDATVETEEESADDSQQLVVAGAEERIAQQMEENKKYETSLDDESGAVCVNNADIAAPVNCQQGWKCCTSKRSYLNNGVAHESQTKLKLYSICCQMDQHCKYDTIFVSCAPGAGPDDYSGVLAGLEEDATVETEVNTQES